MAGNSNCQMAANSNVYDAKHGNGIITLDEIGN
jgi:hypothetical protein